MRTEATPPSAPRRLPPIAWLAIVAMFAAFAVWGPLKMLSSDDGDDGGGNGTTVDMAGLQFSPDALVVPQGTEVVFNNDDVAPHTVTEDSGAVDSGTLSPGSSFTLVITERFEYHCSIHPSMTATVDVEG